jgi:CIC family chloride channel protein
MEAEEKPLPAIVISVLAIAVGVIAGFGAYVFRLMIGFFHNLLFLGTLSLEYDANLHTDPSPWGLGVVFVPVLGALGVSFLIKHFAPEAKGHGVPEVIDAIYYGKGKIRPAVAAVKSLASALSIGSGGSVGREGPIIQIGSAFGSTLGQLIRMPEAQRVTLIAAGAGAGIAATFNTPVGGVAFAAELILPAVSASTMAPLVLAVVTGTYIGRALLGLAPAFDIPQLAAPELELASPLLIALFVPFALLIGLAAASFVRAIYWFEDRFDAMPGNAYTRHMFGMALVGVMIAALMHFGGHYYVQGVGYATIEDVLSGALSAPGLLLLLVVLKLLATGLTLGSGASGGVFSPSLFIGACLGAAYAGLLAIGIPGLDPHPAAFAIAGMAGMIAGTTGALLTASIMLFEMTRDYAVILPLLLVSGIAYALRKSICPPSIYTLKLLRRGHVVPEGLQGALVAAHRVSDVMEPAVVVAESDIDRAAPGETLVVTGEGGTLIEVRRPASTDGVRLRIPAERIITIGESDGVLDAVARMHANEATAAVVVADGADGSQPTIVGVLGDREVAQITRRSAGLMG